MKFEKYPEWSAMLRVGGRHLVKPNKKYDVGSFWHNAQKTSPALSRLECQVIISF